MKVKMKVKRIDVDRTDYRRTAEIYFNKKLGGDEIVHHIDGNHENNEPENLVIMKKSQHSKVHVLFNFENWRKEHTGIVCGDCLYVKVYEDIEKRDDAIGIDTLYSIAEKSMVHDLRRDIFNKNVAEWCYSNAKQWKEENKHDCYKNMNMGVVKW